MKKIIVAMCVLAVLSVSCICCLVGAFFLKSETKSALNICSDCSIPIAGAVDYKEGSIYQVGDIVNVDGVHVLFLGWDRPSQIKFFVFNRSAEEIPVFPQNQMYVIDADSGVYYPSNPMLSIITSADSNTYLRPGDWIHGKFAFINMIFSDISGNTLIYDMDGSATTLVKFEIPPYPIMLEMPDSITNALEGNPGNIGESFTCGYLEILIDNPQVIGQEAILPPLPMNSYLVFDIYAENASDHTVTFNALDTFSLIDGNLMKYQQSFMSVGSVQGKVIELQQLSPGESVSGQIGFEVPNTVENVLLYVLDYGDAANRYFLEISKE
ncbi:MAG: DUF4352 domain-containing protein [Bacteroidales bacterium]|nr:DUF4352 domain-containing protein [Bacteroidales bacterium]